MYSFDWNDLRYVVSVMRNGSAAAAARQLQVSHATVLRRLQMLESQVGTSLFDRLPTGYIVTDAGKRLADLGALIESELVDASRFIERESSDLSGSISFTTTDSIASEIMPEILALFRQVHAGIRVDMRVTNDRLDLERREADVTLRPTAEPPESWVGMRLARLDWGIYASKTCRGSQADVAWQQSMFVMPAGRLASGRYASWISANVAPDRVIGSADSFVALKRMAEAGLGATLLPKMMVRDSELELLQRLPSECSSDLWVLTHESLRNTARIQIFMEFVAQMVRQHRSRFEITSPASA